MHMELKGKKVLVAGGTGLVGTHLTSKLVHRGADVTASCFSRSPKDHAEVYKKYDFTKMEDCLAATKGQDAVFICAVQAAGVAGMKSSPTANLYPNLLIHAGLIEACQQNGVKRVVWISSSTVYQEHFAPLAESDLDLNQPTFPLYGGMGNLYRYLEQLFKYYYTRMGLEVGIIRTTSVYGPHDSFDEHKSHVVPALIRRAIEKHDPYVVWGNGHTVRDFVFADDLAEASIAVLQNYCVGEAINFGHGQPITIREAVKVILDATDHNVTAEYDITKPTAIPYRVLNCDKFESLVGPIQRTDFAEGIRKTVSWYREQI